MGQPRLQAAVEDPLRVSPVARDRRAERLAGCRVHDLRLHHTAVKPRVLILVGRGHDVGVRGRPVPGPAPRQHEHTTGRVGGHVVGEPRGKGDCGNHH